MSSRSLIVMPDDSGKPLLDAINGARASIRVKIFLFSDPSLLAAVIGAHQRGVKVRVMLNPARRGGEPENEATRKALEKAGVAVADTNPAIDLTHEKSMVVDDETAFIQSLNWETKNLTATRDYAVVTTHRHEVDEVSACFDADWERKDFDPGQDPHLIWCNINLCSSARCRPLLPRMQNANDVENIAGNAIHHYKIRPHDNFPRTPHSASLVKCRMPARLRGLLPHCIKERLCGVGVVLSDVGHQRQQILFGFLSPLNAHDGLVQRQ
jgi:hypothetical protein